MTFVQEFRVRYNECDMQNVVFNANYFVYCDDAVDTWTRFALADELKKVGTSTDLHAVGFDFMLKTTQLTWHSPVKFGDTLDMDCEVSRWGRSSFDVVINGIYKALQKAQKEFGLSFKIIMCFLRHLDEEPSFKILDQAIAHKEKIFGVGLDSSEIGNPPSKFKKLFKKEGENKGYQKVPVGLDKAVP